MSRFPEAPIADLVIRDRAQPPATTGDQWLLNLDQIESGTGNIQSWERVPVDALGQSTYYFESGTVLYSKLRPYLNKVVVADRAGYATTELVPLRTNEQKIRADYLSFYLRSPQFLAFATTVVAGAKMPRMVMSEFWKHSAPLPPLPEQRRIAAILDKADALRTKRREAIAKLDQLLQSVFIELFGSSQRINYTNLGTVAEINPSTVVATTGEVPFLPMADVDELEDFVAPKALRKGGEVRTGFTRFTCGDILVAKITPCFENGKTAIVRANGQSGAGSTEFHVIRVDNDDYARMLVTHLRRPHIRIEGERRMTGSAGQRRIPKAFLEGLQVPAPESEGIKRFAKLHRQVAAMKARYRRSDEQMHTLFASLQQRAFAGTL